MEYILRESISKVILKDENTNLTRSSYSYELKGEDTDIEMEVFVMVEEITIWADTKKSAKVVENFPSDTTAIDLSDKRIASLDTEIFKEFPNLEVLTLSGNELSSIDLKYIGEAENLVELSLNANELDTIDLSPLSGLLNLTHLGLSFNRLTTVNLGPLAECKSLKALHLYDNKLDSIDLMPLVKCKKLRNLTLQNNPLKSLDITPLFRAKKLVQFGIDDEVKLTADKKYKDKSIPYGLKSYKSRIEWI